MFLATREERLMTNHPNRSRLAAGLSSRHSLDGTYCRECGGSMFIDEMKYGVGYGQSPCWNNQHFKDLPSAEAFFIQELERAKSAFSRSWGGKYSVADEESRTLIRSVVVQNIKKDGTGGAARFRLQLYALPSVTHHGSPGDISYDDDADHVAVAEREKE